MGGLLTSRRICLTLAVAVLVAVGAVPVFAMLWAAFRSGSFSGMGDLLPDGRQRALLCKSLLLSSLAAASAVAAGVPLAVLLDRTDLPFRRTLTALFTVPLLIPPYVLAVAWAGLVGGGGLLEQAFGTVFAQAAASWLFGLPGCVLVLFTALLPLIMLLTLAHLRTVNPRLEEAALLVCGPWAMLRSVSLALARPGILLAAMLAFLLALGELGVPMFLRYRVFPVESFIQFSAFYDFGAATAAAAPIGLIALAVVGAGRLLIPGRVTVLRPAAHKAAYAVIPLGRLRPVVCVLVVLACAALVFLPLSALAARAASAAALGEALSRAGGALLRSLLFAAAGATALSALGFLVGYLVETRVGRVWRAVDSLTVLLFATPGTVLGVGLAACWNRPATNFIYATPAIIVLGYVAQYIALTSRISASALAAVPPSMEEAAQVAGAGWLRRMAVIVAPLCSRGLAAGWLVGCLFCLRDTGAAMLVYPPGSDTLPVRIFTLMANGSESLVAACCVLQILAALAPAGALAWLARKSGGWL